MSTKKNNGHGGMRKGAGRPPSEKERMKICISVDKENWQAAVTQRSISGSWLVDTLILGYLANGNGHAVKGVS